MEVTSIEHLAQLDKKDLLAAKKQVTLLHRLDGLLEDLNLKDSGRRRGIFSPSSIGHSSGKSLCGKYSMGCGRKLCYEYKDDVEKRGRIKPRIRRIFDTGSAVHLQIQGYLADLAEEEGDIFECEVPAFPETSEVGDLFDIGGTSDGIWTVLTKDKIRFGVEIKSMKHELFEKLTRVKPEHLVQGTVYCALLDIPFMLYLYYDKNDSNWLEFPVPFNEDIWNAVVEKLTMVRDHALSGTMPPREITFFCEKDCPYAYHCKPKQHREGVIRRKFEGRR